MSCETLTEQACIDFLVSEAKNNGETAPRCIVMNRIQKSNSITRYVKFALVVTTENIGLVDALIFKCLDFHDNIEFVGSEVNLQSQELEIEYLYFSAKITAIRQ